MARPKRTQGLFKSNGYWHLRTDPLTGGKLSTKCKINDVDGALRFRSERHRLASIPAHEAARHELVGKWLDVVLESKRTGRVVTKTVTYYESKIKPLRKFFGTKTLDEMGRTDEIGDTPYDSYVKARRQAGLADYTIQRELQVMTAALKRAKKAGRCTLELETLAPEGLEGGVTPGERALSEGEVGKLLAAMPSRKWRAVVALAVSLGCRLSEAERQRKEYFERLEVPRRDQSGNEYAAEVWVCWIDGRKTKGSDRSVPVLSGFLPVILEVLPDLPVGRQSNYDRTFKLACQRAGIPKCSMNDLRRTHATLLVEHGLDERTVANLMGHKTVAMAQRHYNRAQSINLAPVAEAKLSLAAPINIELPTEPAPKERSRKRDRFGEPSDGSNSSGGLLDGTVQKTSSSETVPSFRGRAAQDSNLRPLAPEAETQPEQFQQTTVCTCGALYSSVHHRTVVDGGTVQKTSRSDSDRRAICGGNSVPLISSSGQVVSWVRITDEEVEADLAPRELSVRSRKVYERRVGVFARALRDRAGSLLEVTP